MGTAALPAFTTIIKQGDVKPPSTPTVWTPLAEVKSITEFTIDRNEAVIHTYGTSPHPSTILTTANPSSVDLQLVYTQAQFDALWTLVNATGTTGALEWWRIENSDGYYIEFEANVKTVSAKYEIAGEIYFDVTLISSQDPNYTNA